MPAKFQLKKGTTGKFRFVVLSSSGQVVATSEPYERKASALAGIRSIEKIVASGAAVEDTTTKEWAEAEAARKAAKKAGPRKSVKKAVKQAVAKVSEVAPEAPKKAAPKKAAPKKAASSKAAPKKAATKPVRKPPPPITTPPEQLVPKI